MTKSTSNAKTTRRPRHFIFLRQTKRAATRPKMKSARRRVIYRAAGNNGPARETMNDLEDADPEQAIRRALARLLPKLRRFCLALAASPADADDLCQSTLERAITRLDLWVPGTRLDSWLYRIAQNLHKNTLRDRSNRLRLLEEHASDPSTDQTPEGSDAEASELRRHVLALPEDQRKILMLITVEGYSYKECASLLDLPQTTVTNRLFQARMHLRQAIAPDTEDDDASKRRASA